MIKYALDINFFSLINYFEKNEKISMDDVGKCNNFDELRQKLSENALRGKYLKDIFNILDSLNVSYVEKGDTNVHVKEMLQRRNIHIHNRGIVDERYAEKDGTTFKYNIYNLNIGDIAHIDESYWLRVNRICTNIIRNMANWIAAMEVFPTILT